MPNHCNVSPHWHRTDNLDMEMLYIKYYIHYYVFLSIILYT